MGPDDPPGFSEIADEPTKPGLPDPPKTRSPSTQALYTYQLGIEALCASASHWRPLPDGAPRGNEAVFRKVAQDWLGNAMQVGHDSRDEEFQILRGKYEREETTVALCEDRIRTLEAELLAAKAELTLKDARIARLQDAVRGRDPRAE